MEQIMETERLQAKMPILIFCKVSPAAIFLHMGMKGKKNKQTALGWSPSPYFSMVFSSQTK